MNIAAFLLMVSMLLSIVMPRHEERNAIDHTEQLATIIDQAAHEHEAGIQRSIFLREYVPKMTAEVIARLDALSDQFGESLSEEDQFMLYCLRFHVDEHRYTTADYDQFIAILDSCATSEDVSSLLHSDFRFLGTFPDFDCEGMAEEVLSQCGFGHFKYRMYFPRLDALYLYAGDALNDMHDSEDAASPYVQLFSLYIDSSGKVLSQRSYFNKSTELEEAYLLSKAESSKIIAIARQFFTDAIVDDRSESGAANTYELGEDDIRVSKYAYSSELDENVAWAWIYRPRIVASSGERCGIYCLIGLDTSMVYWIDTWHGETNLDNLKPRILSLNP